MCVLQRGNSGEGCDLASTLCKYTFRKGDLCVLSRARVRQMRRGCTSSELLVRGGGVCSILLYMPRDNRCMYMAHVYFYVCCGDCVGVCENVCYVAAVVKDSVFSLRVLKYAARLCKGCDGCFWVCVRRGAAGARCSCMGSMSVSSCICCMFVSCVHPVAVFNAAFCMTCTFSTSPFH